MLSNLCVLIWSIAKDLKEINGKDDFEKKLSEDGIDNRKLLLKTDFFDFPFKDVPLIRNNNRSHTYIYSFIVKDDESKQPIFFKTMYIDTIYGAFIVIDLLNKQITENVGFWLNIMTTNHGNGFYQQKESKCHIKLTYFPSIDKYFAIISGSLELYNHPFYPANKIYDHF
jgi:hypothetical protein